MWHTALRLCGKVMAYIICMCISVSDSREILQQCGMSLLRRTLVSPEGRPAKRRYKCRYILKERHSGLAAPYCITKYWNLKRNTWTIPDNVSISDSFHSGRHGDTHTVKVIQAALRHNGTVNKLDLKCETFTTCQYFWYLSVDTM